MFNEVPFEEFISKEKKSLISGPFGSDISAKYFTNEGVPVIRGNNLSTGFEKFIDAGFVYVSEQKAEELNAYAIYNDLVFTAVGTLGQVGIIPKKSKFQQYVISNKQIRVRLDTLKLNPLYAFYWFSSPWMVNTLKSRNVGSTVPLINLGIIRNLPVRAPEKLLEQKKITDVLSALDSKIELNNRINAELEAMAKTLYDYWFVQFDFPIYNKDGTLSRAEGYKTSGGKMVWNEELKREIPEGWEVKELQGIAKCLMGQSPKGESYNQDGIGIPLLNGPADYENGALKGRTYTTEPTRLCQKDDLVLCIRATIGNLVYSEQEFCLGRGVAAVRANDKRLSELIYFILIQEIERFKVQATGSIIVGITKDDLIESKCLIPEERLVDSFHNLIKPQFDKIRTNIKENLKLTELRDWLLPMLMNGQVKVKDEEETELLMAAEPESVYKAKQ
jgi:type I restriction enzyme S subunit